MCGGSCGFERLVAFSCKLRGLCPSCAARRMADTAAQFTDWRYRTALAKARLMIPTLLKKLRVSKQPLIITQNGKAAGVVLSPAAYDELTERFRFMAAVEEGLTDAEAGRLHDHASVAAEMRET
jgi:prevent-host-death family protein